MSKISNIEELRAAQDYFRDNKNNLFPTEIYAFSKVIKNTSQQFNTDCPEEVIKIADAPQYNDKSISNLIKDRIPYTSEVKVKSLEKDLSFKKTPIEKIAAIENFDIENEIDNLWDKFTINPLKAVFKLTEKPAVLVKIANETIPIEVLEKKKAVLNKYFKPSFIEKIASDPSKIVELPFKIQQLISELMNG
jgi:hypothetical protein